MSKTIIEDPGPTRMIAGYQLQEKLGEGGMGVVYKALQTVPVKRTVALKIIRRGMDSKEVVARFDAERQALALMDHASIAKVLSLSKYYSGSSFYVDVRSDKIMPDGLLRCARNDETVD